MKVSIIFPGQGSQNVGMGKFLYENFSYVKELFEEASDVLGQNFKKLCFDGPDWDLVLTENTQPALVIVSVATYRTLQKEIDFFPVSGAGHSVGEYSAAVASQTLKFSDALRAVKARGLAMQAAVPVGQGVMMAVLGLQDNEVKVLCQWVQNQTGKLMEPANFNCPGQVVISGDSDAGEWLQEHIKESPLGEERKIKLIKLKVSAPFHSKLMMPAQEVMKDVLGGIDFCSPDWPIVQNITAQFERDGETIRSNLVSQISGAVRWTECVQTMVSGGSEIFIECGPGRVLNGLVKKIAPTIETCNILNLEDLKVLIAKGLKK